MKFNLTCLLALVSLSLFGQVKEINPFFADSEKNQQEDLRISLPKATSMGKHYYTEEWQAGNVKLKNGNLLRGYFIRYELVRNQVEIIIGREIRVISGDRIEFFEWYNTQVFQSVKFLNKSTYQFHKEVTPGFFEILVEGDAILLKRTLVTSLRGSTSPTLVANTKASSIEKFELFYLVIDGVAEELHGNKKKKLDLFGSKSDVITSYVRENKLRLSDEDQLIKVAQYYNTL